MRRAEKGSSFTRRSVQRIVATALAVITAPSLGAIFAPRAAQAQTPQDDPVLVLNANEENEFVATVGEPIALRAAVDTDKQPGTNELEVCIRGISGDANFVSIGPGTVTPNMNDPAEIDWCAEFQDIDQAVFGPTVDYSNAQNDAVDFTARHNANGFIVETVVPATIVIEPAPPDVFGAIRSAFSGAAVPAITVTAAGSSTLQAQTDAAGAYSFTSLDAGAWTITPQDPNTALDPVELADVEAALEIAVGRDTAAGHRLFACDVSGNGRVTAYDAALLLQLRAGLRSDVPVSLACNLTRAFFPAAAAADNQTLTDPVATEALCQPGSISFSALAGDVAMQDFVVVPLGACFPGN